MILEDEASSEFLAHNTLDIICRAGVDMVLRSVSDSSFSILGFKPEEMIGKRPHAFLLKADEGAFTPPLAILLSAHAKQQPVTLRMQSKKGDLVWMQFLYHPVCDAVTGRPTEIIIVMRDISDRKQLEDKLAVLLPTDPLTGLATRRTFDDVLEREWNRTARDGARLSLLLLDFLDFKQFHMRQGHVEGDSCLSKAAAAITRALRSTDLAARYEAEHIAVILPATGPGGASKVAEKLIVALEPLRCSQRRSMGGQTHAAVSIGISTLLGRPGTMKTPDLLTLAADTALQQARAQEANLHRRQRA